jgi:hypothetical protein
MAGSHLDVLARLLAGSRSRRDVALQLRSLALGGVGRVLAPQASVARRHRKKRKRHVAPSTSGACIPACAGRVCGDDGCGGFCGTACPSPRNCEQGLCRCPSEFCDSSGACIPRNQCCLDAECPTGSACCGGVCLDVMQDVNHCGSCDEVCGFMQRCEGSRCCLDAPNQCIDDGQCCGALICYQPSSGLGNCAPCSTLGQNCGICCRGLFCVEGTCQRCVPEMQPCQENADCCAGLFCQPTSQLGERACNSHPG